MGIGGVVKRIFGRKGAARAGRFARPNYIPGAQTGRILPDPNGLSGMFRMERAAGQAGEFGSMGSFIGGAFAPAVKAGVAFGVSSGLGDIADQTDNSLIGAAAGLGSFWAGTIGFRQALRAPLRGARAKWGHRRDALGGSVRQLSRVYDKYMYAPERIIGKGLKGGLKGFGRAMVGRGKGDYASPVPLLLRPLHGMASMGRAFVSGSIDRVRYAGRVMRHGSKAQKLPGITGRMMGVRHPFWGAMGVGAMYAGARSVQRYNSGRIGDTRYASAPADGINPRNWGGGITMMNARGGVQYRMGSDKMAQNMARSRSGRRSR